MQNSFLGKEDHGLKDRLLGELPGIFNWAIQGWRDLNQHGYFVEPASSRDAVEELAALTSPTRRFVSDRCTVGPGKTVGVGDIYAAWKLWCEEVGRDHPGTSASLGRDLRAAVPRLGSRQRRDVYGTTRYYEGIGLL